MKKLGLIFLTALLFLTIQTPESVKAQSADYPMGAVFNYLEAGSGLGKYQDLADFNLSLSKGVFLVASRNIIEPTFSKSVILLIAYDDSGAMGLIINKPSKIKLKNLLSGVKGFYLKNKKVFFGGPVSINSLFIIALSDKKLDDSKSVRIFDSVYLMPQFNEVKDVLTGRVIKRQLRVFAGYAGWAPGQLEYEVLRGDWYIMPADENIIFFKNPEDIWPELIKKSSSRLVMLMAH